MQLKGIGTTLIGILGFCGFTNAQETDTSHVAAQETEVHLEDIEVTFLSSYYEQDGNHSPVTGGIGTEFLTNIAPSIIVNVPLDEVQSISLNGGVDFYSSASSDNINNPYLLDNHVSSASAHDARSYATLGYKRKNKPQHTTIGYTAGFSHEYDVNSYQIGMSWSKTSKDENQEISLKGSYYFDDWKVIYPIEWRNSTDQFLPTDKRHTVTLSATGSTVLNKRMNIALTTDVIFQKGILNTPFHRVYFVGEEKARIEKLPGQRVKFPIGLRFNYHVTDFLILKSFYRYYFDTWGLTGNTISLEAPLKLGNSFRLYPFYRYHSQTGARYFAPFEGHSADAMFYTSDYDLSTLTSQKYGLGFSFEPLNGIFRWKTGRNSLTLLKRLDFRYAQYSRSDGLNASIYSLSMQFNIKR